MRLFRSIFLTDRFFTLLVTSIGVFVLGYIFPFCFTLAKGLAFIALLLVGLDLYLLYGVKEGLTARRTHDAKLSNGDDNDINLHLSSSYRHAIHAEVIDEIPHQFQRRDILWKLVLDPRSNQSMQYQLRPTKRGEYDFGAINVFAATAIGLVQRRYRFVQDELVPVYPSIIQMKKYEFSAFTNHLVDLGIKRIRRVGQTTEFDQIKEYVSGDDPRNINWKASAKSLGLMVNHYEDEKSQPVYCVVDKGRLMRSPFNQLTLLDYAINSSLVMTKIALNKQDKAGLITFADKMSTVVKADRRSGQMGKLLEALYQQKTYYRDSNFELLSVYIRRVLTQRSLLLLYTNFESLSSFRRQLPYLRSLSRRHLLVVIFFENTELKAITDNNPEDGLSIYTQVVTEQLMLDKHLIVRELKKYGIYAILTTPEMLNVHTINQYLELKARGMI